VRRKDVGVEMLLCLCDSRASLLCVRNNPKLSLHEPSRSEKVKYNSSDKESIFSEFTLYVYIQPSRYEAVSLQLGYCWMLEKEDLYSQYERKKVRLFHICNYDLKYFIF
jgi:hypothetical protein